MVKDSQNPLKLHLSDIQRLENFNFLYFGRELQDRVIQSLETKYPALSLALHTFAHIKFIWEREIYLRSVRAGQSHQRQCNAQPDVPDRQTRNMVTVSDEENEYSVPHDTARSRRRQQDQQDGKTERAQPEQNLSPDELQNPSQPGQAAPRAPRQPQENRPPQRNQSQPTQNHAAYITDDPTRWPEPHELGSINQDRQHCKGCGAAHWFEERNKKKRMRPGQRNNPTTFFDCCKHNTIRLPHVSDPFPEELKSLFTGEGHTFHDVQITRRLREQFCDNSRAINNKLVFACITNTNQDKAINKGKPGHRVPWVYRIHGQMYRQMGPAQTRSHAVAAQYSQLYFHDGNESLEAYRLAFENNYVLQSIVQNTHMWLREYNSFARNYRSLKEIIDAARENDQEIPLYSIQFNSHIDLDHRTYNPPPLYQTAP
jgi:hypothetical protein